MWCEPDGSGEWVLILTGLCDMHADFKTKSGKSSTALQNIPIIK